MSFRFGRSQGKRTELFFGGNAMNLARHPNKVVAMAAAPLFCMHPRRMHRGAYFLNDSLENIYRARANDSTPAHLGHKVGGNGTWQYLRAGATETPTSFAAGTDDTTGKPVPASPAWAGDAETLWAQGFWT